MGYVNWIQCASPLTFPGFQRKHLSYKPLTFPRFRDIRSTFRASPLTFSRFGVQKKDKAGKQVRGFEARILWDPTELGNSERSQRFPQRIPFMQNLRLKLSVGDIESTSLPTKSEIEAECWRDPAYFRSCKARCQDGWLERLGAGEIQSTSLLEKKVEIIDRSDSICFPSWTLCWNCLPERLSRTLLP